MRQSCPNSTSCPELGFRACSEVAAENARLKSENAQLRHVFQVATQAFEEKDSQIAELKRENEVLRRKLNEELRKPFTRQTGKDSASDAAGSTGHDKEGDAPKKRGAPKGHRGGTRKKPDTEPDRTVFVPAERCPHCGSDNTSSCKDVQEHILEDIVLAKPEVVLFRRQRGYCRDCQVVFTARLPDDLPKGYVGATAKAVAQYLHYVAHVPFESVVKIFKELYGLDITPAALAGFDKKLAGAGRPLYEVIREMARYSSAINIDESGWPVGPLSEWLWTFTNPDFALFVIDESRAHGVVEAVLGKHYGGVLGSDCFSAYNPLETKAKQKCLTHYERAAKNVEKFFPDDAPALEFAAAVKDIFKCARQVKRDWLADTISDNQAARKAGRFEKELDELTATPLENEDAENLRNRLIRHRKENFVFLRHREVEPDNNRAERALRPSVVMRKISYGNNAPSGARNHETIMTLIETAKLHDADLLGLLKGLATGRDAGRLKRLLFGKIDAEKPQPPLPQHAAPG